MVTQQTRDRVTDKHQAIQPLTRRGRGQHPDRTGLGSALLNIAPGSGRWPRKVLAPLVTPVTSCYSHPAVPVWFQSLGPQYIAPYLEDTETSYSHRLGHVQTATSSQNTLRCRCRHHYASKLLEEAEWKEPQGQVQALLQSQTLSVPAPMPPKGVPGTMAVARLLHTQDSLGKEGHHCSQRVPPTALLEQNTWHAHPSASQKLSKARHGATPN